MEIFTSYLVVPNGLSVHRQVLVVFSGLRMKRATGGAEGGIGSAGHKVQGGRLVSSPLAGRPLSSAPSLCLKGCGPQAWPEYKKNSSKCGCLGSCLQLNVLSG